MKRILCTLAAFSCLVIVGAGNARGQGLLGWPEWLPVASNGITANAIYFFDATHAVMAQGANIYYLGPADPAGLKWDHASMPAGVQFIAQLRFIQGKLYAASLGTDVLVSVDSGKTWTNSGLGLANANDVYADGSGSIRALHDPMRVFARLDTMHCIAQGNEQIFVSSDGGVTWTSTGVPMVDSNSLGAFADRCKNVYVCPNSWGTVFHSTDLGQTWQTVVTGSGPGSEYINGASTVVYEGCDAGMYRSTDDGSTWTSVITVQNYTAPLDVWGPMGEHVAVFGSNGIFGWHCIFMTATGGLDDLHSGIAMTDSNGMPLSQEDTLNLPLRLTSMCNAFFIPVPLEADVGGLTAKISISGDRPDDFTLLDTQTYALPYPYHREDDTDWVAYTPHHPVDTLSITIENHWNCSDWTDTRTAIVVAIPSLSIVPPPPIAGNCKPVTSFAVLQLDSCQTLVTDSIIIPPAISARLHYTGPLPDTVRRGMHDSLYFTFDPRDTLATIVDSVELFAHFPGMDTALGFWDWRWYLTNDTTFPSLTNVDTFISVKLLALSSAPLLGSNVSSITTHPVALCSTVDTFAIIRDTGCDSVCVSSVALRGTGFRITGSDTAICLGPGTSDTIWLATQADTAGHPTANVDSLIVSSDAVPPLAPIMLSYGIEYPVPWNLTISPPDSAGAGQSVIYQIIQHGSLPPDVNSIDFQITFNDDVLDLSGIDEPWAKKEGYYRDSLGIAHYLLRISPIPQDSILATLNLTAYQARETETDLQLDNIAFTSGSGVQEDCAASVSTSASHFSFLTKCGGPTLAGFLKSGTITISAIIPNPAQDQTVVTIYSADTKACSSEILVLDDIGRTLLHKKVTIEPGLSYISIDLGSLPKGIYEIELSGAAVGHFAKE